MARCLSNYGERKGVDMRLQAAEWQASLGPYPIARLDRALTEHIRTSTWWPTIANLIDLMREETPSPGTKRSDEGPKNFLRDGRTDAEEIAYRVSQSLKWKDEAGFGGPSRDPLDAVREPKPASQDMTVSAALLRTCGVRRNLGLETCFEGCGKNNCELKETTQ